MGGFAADVDRAAVQAGITEGNKGSEGIVAGARISATFASFV
jgi:hypothetical protein